MMRLTAILLAGVAVAGCRVTTVSTRSPEATPISPVTSAVQLRDEAAQAGLNYQWQIVGKRPLNILQTIGNGCAFLDYDNDGSLDVLLVGPRPALYRGDGHGHFTEVTREVGFDKLRGRYLGCAVGDYDGDGYDDIYLSGYRTGTLLRNHQGQRFDDVTRQAGLAPQPWGTSCAWAETVPGSGRLDLFIANYVRFGAEPGIPQLCASHTGIMATCGPRYYKPLRGVFYRNLGASHFLDASAVMGLQATGGRSLGVAFAPLNGSGPLALAIANDETPGDLLVPHTAASRASAARPPASEVLYQDAGATSGMAFDRDGNIHGGMGIDWGDYSNEGRLGLFVATFQQETKSLYHDDGHELFSDASYATGIANSTIPNVAFGCKFFDVDNDGWLDLMVTNGHVQDNVHAIDSGTTYRQPTQLFHNRGHTPVGFDDLSQVAGPDLQRPIVGRGLAVGDYDNDGRVDALVVDSEGKPLLLHNQSAPVGHWLGVQLRGTRSNRDGLGALLTASLGQRQLMRLCHTDGSYLSASERRVHFGLGLARVVDTLRIRWPSGHTDVLHHIPADRYITIREGGALLAPPQAKAH